MGADLTVKSTGFAKSLKVTPSPPAILANAVIPEIPARAMVNVSSSAIVSSVMLLVAWIISIFDNWGINVNPPAADALFTVNVSTPAPPSRTS